MNKVTAILAFTATSAIAAPSSGGDDYSYDVAPAHDDVSPPAPADAVPVVDDGSGDDHDDDSGDAAVVPAPEVPAPEVAVPEAPVTPEVPAVPVDETVAVDEYVTFFPEPTEFSYGSKTHIVSEPTTFNLFDECPCTIVIPVSVAPVNECAQC